ncbi:MAG: DUF6713 family protein [Anaerolineales bacterium]
MILQIVFWIYLVNCVLLILHEMDSAYWKEWDLFRLQGGIGEFLLIHFPLYLAGLYGLVLLSQGAFAGLILSLVLAAAGIFAFCIHTYFLRQGRPEFNTRVSKGILGLLLIVSIAQIAATIAYWISA